MKELEKFSLGLKFIFSGVSAINSTKGLWKWTIGPFFIDVVLLFFFMSYTLGNLSLWVAAALGFIFTTPEGWLYSLTYYPLYIILAIGFTVISIYGVYLLATVIASPFNSVIAEKILMKNGVIQNQPFQFTRWIKTSLNMMWVSLIRALLFAFIGIFLFFLSFIPGLNIVSSFTAFLIMAFDSMDYSYEMAELSLKQRITHLKSEMASYSGMGTVIGLTLFIPGLTLFLMPFLVAGAAEVYSKTK